MNLHVKRFTVRYQGKDYGPGSVIYDVEQEQAKSLIAGGSGTIEALPEREESAPAATSLGRKGKEAKDADISVTDDMAGLPAVDPSKTVK